jgi:hypothetical protein
VDVRAHGVGRASQVNNLLAVLARGSAIDVVKDDVGDIDSRWVCCTLSRIDVEVALVQHKGFVGVLDVDVAVGDVVDASITDVLTGPSLETGTVLNRWVSYLV